MNNAIEEKMNSIMGSVKSDMDMVVVRVECPLSTGVKVECQGIIKGEKHNLPIPGGVRDFFVFVDKRRAEKSQEKFNLVEFTLNAAKQMSVRFSFDENIQKHAEDNIR